MAPMSNPIASIKITAARAVILNRAIDDIAEHIAPLVPYWKRLSPARKAALLAASPVLRRIVTEIVEVLA